MVAPQTKDVTTRAILLIALAIFGFANMGRADIDKSSYFVVSYSRPNPLDSAKESLIKEGMILKQVVANLGPGWMSPNEGLGFIQWFFDDGAALYILPRWRENEVVTYKGQNGTTLMRWVPRQN